MMENNSLNAMNTERISCDNIFLEEIEKSIKTLKRFREDYVLLGGCIIPNNKTAELCISEGDAFDELCKKIREFRHYNTDFIFEYENGKKRNLVYDFINNTVEYTDKGVEHYESLLFYEVDDFSMETYEKLDAGIREEQKVYLNRANLPIKIFGVHRDKHLEEIVW